MAKGSGEQKIAVTGGSSGGFKMGKRGKQQVGYPFTPEKAFWLTGGLVIGTLVLHVVSKVFAK